MSKRINFKKQVYEVDVVERISLARESVAKLTDQVQEVLALNESNKITFYSNILSEQIPESRAASAYNLFQSSMFKFEIIRLLSLWDNPADNNISILTVVLLIEDNDVIQNLKQSEFNHHANSKPAFFYKDQTKRDMEELSAQFEDGQRAYAKERANKLEVSLRQTIKDVNDFVKSETKTSLKNTRYHLSHSLTQTHAEKESPINPMKYGDETALLKKSCAIIEDLYCWVNGTSFDIEEDCRRIYREEAEELWNNCRFDLPAER